MRGHKGESSAKISIYLGDELLKELRAEAKRQDRSLSWVLCKAWALSRESIQAMPSHREQLERVEVSLAEQRHRAFVMEQLRLARECAA